MKLIEALFSSLPVFIKMLFPVSCIEELSADERPVRRSDRMAARSLLTFIGAGLAVLSFAPSGHAADADAARRLAKSNDCFKCHAIGKDKDGPAYRKIAAKYRKKANAETRLVEHVTLGDVVKFPDGHEEEHKIVKTVPPDDMQQIKNLVQWILAQ